MDLLSLDDSAAPASAEPAQTAVSNSDGKQFFLLKAQVGLLIMFGQLIKEVAWAGVGQLSSAIVHIMSLAGQRHADALLCKPTFLPDINAVLSMIAQQSISFGSDDCEPNTHKTVNTVELLQDWKPCI